MDVSLTAQDLLAFQEDIKERFLRGEIRHPIHLCDPNQLDYLIPLFQEIQPQDWLFTTYRGMFHWLLKDVPPDYLRQWIIEHGAMNFCDKEHRIISSAIVGGCLPIAVGTALAIKRQDGWEWVWCFLGDMAAETGTFKEALTYSVGHCLPIKFIIENNGLSTNTPTHQVYGKNESSYPIGDYEHLRHVLYQRNVPHVGVGQWVTFS